jgi:hypothetical protein
MRWRLETGDWRLETGDWRHGDMEMDGGGAVRVQYSTVQYSTGGAGNLQGGWMQQWDVDLLTLQDSGALSRVTRLRESCLGRTIARATT